jgi:hypothetical protein
MKKIPFCTAIQISNSKNKRIKTGRTPTSREKTRNNRAAKSSTPRSNQSSRRKMAKRADEKSPSEEYNSWRFAELRTGFSSSPNL